MSDQSPSTPNPSDDATILSGRISSDNDVFQAFEPPAPVVEPPAPVPVYQEAQQPVFQSPPVSPIPPAWVNPGEPPKKSQKTIWIIVAVAAVVLLLCCCCMVGGFALFSIQGPGGGY